jgi:FkbH-like protein
MKAGMKTEFSQVCERLRKESTYPAYAALANLLDSLEKFGLEPLRIAVLRNFTVEPVLPVLRGELALLGFFPNLYVGEFDAIAEDVYNPDSPLYEHKPDFILITQWLETLSTALTTTFIQFSEQEIDEEIERLIKTMKGFLSTLRGQTSAPILINNFPLLDMPTLGILDSQSENYHTYRIIKLNQEMLKTSRQFKDIYWVDYLSLFSRIGRSKAFDERYWHMARSPLGKSSLVPLGKEYGKFFRALCGKMRKCLVLDCDNTLWGGVVGEDGLAGIKLGTTFPGSAYQAFQQEILNLYHRGVILALCSKNNESDVLEVLREHPEMILKEEHFATSQINWNDKASNLVQISNDLNISLDSLVFVDDKAFECDWVRKQLPEVTVFHLDGKTSSYRHALGDAGMFDTLIFSLEDRQRSEMYGLTNERKRLLESSSSLEEYLTGLKLRAEIGIPKNNEISRISQLTQKTNQFNLTTRRYTEGDIQNFLEEKESAVYYLRLSDRISDLGIVGVVILKFEGEQAEIDSFLFSCRALGRGAEDALFYFILNQMVENGVTHLKGVYMSTAKNSQVSDFYEKQEFELTKQYDKVSEWSYTLKPKADHLKSYPQWISVVHELGSEK